MRSLIVLLLLGACHGSQNAVTPVSFDDVDQAYITAQCTYRVRCGLAADMASCAREQYHGLFVPPNAGMAVALGRMVFDPDALAACLAPIANASCAESDRDPRPGFVCKVEVFRASPGQLDGAACSNPDECVSQNCVFDPAECPSGCCEGRCQGSTPPATSLPAQLGEACMQARWGPDNCVAGTVCSYVSSTCVQVPGAGEDCIRTGGRCQPGLACVWHSDLSGTTCTALPGVGEPCPDLRCNEVNLVCDPAAHICVTGSLPGGPCPCASLTFWCNPQTQLCERLPGPGESCERQMLCDDTSTFCDLNTDATGLCQPRKPPGGTCTDPWDCATTDCGTDGKCMPLPAATCP